MDASHQCLEDVPLIKLSSSRAATRTSWPMASSGSKPDSVARILTVASPTLVKCPRTSTWRSRSTSPFARSRAITPAADAAGRTCLVRTLNTPMSGARNSGPAGGSYAPSLRDTCQQDMGCRSKCTVPKGQPIWDLLFLRRSAQFRGLRTSRPCLVTPPAEVGRVVRCSPVKPRSRLGNTP